MEAWLRPSRLGWADSAPRWFTRPKTVTHTDTNLTWCRVTMLIETSVLLLSQTGIRQPVTTYNVLYRLHLRCCLFYIMMVLLSVFVGGRLELNGMKRRLTWEATPRSVHDGVASAVASSDCLVFDANVARLFADASGNLSINVTVTIC